MKNIHLIPTDPNDETGGGLWIKDNRDWCHIYITSKEDIKRYSEHYIDLNNNKVKTSFENRGVYLPGEKKIILTTDSELIEYGVQPIDDEFLEWFVKNPSCEFVEVKKQMLCDYCGGEYCDNLACRGFKDSPYHKIIIPKEESKQEVIEEPTDRMYNYEDLKDICERYHNMMCLYGKSKTEDWFDFKFKK
jgi:hypothetical protein